MIFVSIGSLQPFDRLVRRMDLLAPRMPDQTFLAQIGDGAYEPRNMSYVRLLSRRAFMDKLKEAQLLVTHAGMGSVISAMEVATPVVLLPRVLSLGEVNTDHQMATARWLDGRPGLHVCFDEEDLQNVIEKALGATRPGETMKNAAPPEFIDKIRQFIASP